MKRRDWNFLSNNGRPGERRRLACMSLLRCMIKMKYILSKCRQAGRLRSQTAFAVLLAMIVAQLDNASQTRPAVNQSIREIQHLFQNPPDDSRVMMRWWWFGP